MGVSSELGGVLLPLALDEQLRQGWTRVVLVLHPLSSCCHARYESGDHVAVYPANDSALVNQIGEILGTDLDTIMSLNNLDGECRSP